jgi:hypothetical protein
MKIPLSEFEMHVRPEPLERALVIFERGQVDALRSDGKGKTEGVVLEGGATWHPQLLIQAETVLAAACDCDDQGDPPCRHAIAILFALQSGQFPEGVATRSGKVRKEAAPGGRRGRPKLEESEAKAKPVKKAKPPKAPKTAGDLLGIVPHDELVAFLQQQFKIDKSFEVRFKAHFSELLPAANPKEIIKRISETIKAANAVKGKIKAADMKLLVARLQDWVKEGERLLDAQEYSLAFTAAEELFDRVRYLVYHTNFTAGDGLPLIDQTGKLAEKMSAAEIPTAIRAELFKEALARVNKHLNGFTPGMRLFARIAAPGDEFGKLNELLPQLYGNSNDAAIAAHWAMVKRVKGEKAGEEFKVKNKALRFFVNLEIETFIKAKNYDAATKIAQQAYEKAGYFFEEKKTWLDRMDEILELKGDKEARVKLALRAFHEDLVTERVSLHHIRSLVGDARWAEERTALADPIATKSSPNVQRLWYLWDIDQDWPGFLKYLSRYKLRKVLELGEILTRKMPKEYVQLLKDSVLESIQKKTLLHDYELSQMLNILVPIEGKDVASAYFEDLQRQFPQNHVLKYFGGRMNQLIRYRFW